jgi:hypothetical protein
VLVVLYATCTGTCTAALSMMLSGFVNRQLKVNEATSAVSTAFILAFRFGSTTSSIVGCGTGTRGCLGFGERSMLLF